MNEDKTSENKKYMVSFDTKFLIQGRKYEEVLEKVKLEINRKLDEAVPQDTTFSITLVGDNNQEDLNPSYVDDWEFDEVW